MHPTEGYNKSPAEANQNRTPLRVAELPKALEQGASVNRSTVESGSRDGPASAANRVHQPLGLDESSGIDLVPFPLRRDGLTNGPGNLLISDAPA